MSLISISLAIFTSLNLFAVQATAQKPTDAQLKSALTFCLFEKFPGVKDSFVDPRQTTAFDLVSKRNFAWDDEKQAWIDIKSGEAVCGGSQSKLKSALTFCLFEKFPGVKDSFVDPRQTTAFDHQSRRNFAWDADKNAWIDTKTGECICPKCPPTPAPAAGTIDRCLVGTWRSESYVGASSVRYRGGSGILLSVKADGQTTIDYSGMQPVEQIHPVTQEIISKEWRSGEATGHITTSNGLVTVSSVEKSKLDGKETNQYGTKSLSASGLGTVFLGGGKAPSPYNLNYACSETALAIKQVVGSQALRTFNFKREKKEP